MNMIKKFNNEEIIEMLTTWGVSVTNTRVSLIKFILSADHPTADSIINFAKKSFPKVNIATIYNTLDMLEEKKAIKKIRLSNSSSLVYDNNIKPHYHLLNKDGKIIDLDPSDIELTIKNTTLKFDEIEILLKEK